MTRTSMFIRQILAPQLCRQLSLKNFWKRKDLGKFHIVEPGNVSTQKQVPAYITKPSYHESGHPTEYIQFPEIKNSTQILGMRKSCKLAAIILQQIGDYLKVGVSTDDVDCFTHNLIINSNAYPSPLNYKQFPKSVCTSVNNVACHGIPDDRKLEDGDIINVDITVYYEGYHGDCSKTFLVGNVDDIGKDLVAATETCLNKAISICKPDRKFSEIGELIQREAKRLGFTVVPAFIGHGIGHYFHGPPDIYHIDPSSTKNELKFGCNGLTHKNTTNSIVFKKQQTQLYDGISIKTIDLSANDYPGEMKPGMTFTIEPCLSCGGPDIVILEDGWTAVTLDFARTAQFEHTVLITNTGVEVLTL